MKVNFSFSQTLQTAHPDKQVEIIFSGEALVTELEEVQIYRVYDTDPVYGMFLDIPNGYLAQNLATGEMGEFLGKCREAARNAYYKERMKEAATQHNAGFVPMASDISYMEESDRFPDVTIDRS